MIGYRVVIQSITVIMFIINIRVDTLTVNVFKPLEGKI